MLFGDGGGSVSEETLEQSTAGGEGPPQLLGEEHSRKRSIPESVQRSGGRCMMGLFTHQKAGPVPSGTGGRCEESGFSLLKPVG